MSRCVLLAPPVSVDCLMHLCIRIMICLFMICVVLRIIGSMTAAGMRKE
jgi:hypothetical protein